MRKVLQTLGMAALAGVLTLALLFGRVGTVHPGDPAPQWGSAFQLVPAAVAQQPRETPPNIVRSPDRTPARGESGWVGWALLLAIPAVIIAWVVVRRRRMRGRTTGDRHERPGGKS